MNLVSSLRHRGSLLFVGITCALVGFAAGTFAEVGKQMVVTASEDVRFVPVDPARPDGPEIAVLWGDPAKGPSDMLLKLKKAGGRLHYHTSDYHLMLLQGTVRHWAAGEKEAEVKPLGPGSYWFQPGGQAHGDSCLTEECLMFIHWADKRDAVLYDGPS